MVTNSSNTSVQCETVSEDYLLTSNHEILTSVTVFLAVISLFTVVANCIVISAIARAYIYGIPSGTKRPKPYRQTVSKARQCYHSLLKTLTCKTTNEDDLSSIQAPSSITVQNRLSSALNQSVNSMETEVMGSSKELDSKSLGVTDDLVSVENSPEIKGEIDLTKISVTRNEELSETGKKVLAMSNKVKTTSACSFESDSIKIGHGQAPGFKRSQKVTHPLTFGRRVRMSSDSSSIPIVLMFSMALSDTLLGAVIMPLSILEIYNNGLWPYGSLVCMLRTTLDVVLSTTSIYHVTCMAGDRYLAVCRPFLHRKFTVKIGVLATSLCWAVPICIVTLFSVFHLVSTTDSVDIPSTKCPELEQTKTNFSVFNQTSASSLHNTYGSNASFTSKEVSECFQNFTIYAQAVLVTICFYIPFLLIFILYFLVMVEIKSASKRNKALQETLRKQAKVQKCSKTVAKSTSVSRDSPQILETFHSNTKQKMEQQNSESFCFLLIQRIFRRKSYAPNSKELQSTKSKQYIEADEYIQCNRTGTEISTSMPVERKRPTGTNSSLPNNSTDKTLKAAKTIGLVVLCFTVCWFPFSIMVLVLSIEDGWISDWHVLLITWLGYINSSLNPILYCGHRTIRAAIKDMLCGPCRKSS